MFNDFLINSNSPDAPINPGFQSPVISIGLPILIFTVVLVFSIYLIYLIQKGKLLVSDSISWTLWNVFMIFISLSLLITQIISQTSNQVQFNWMQWLANGLGLKESNAWVVLLLIFFIIFLYFKSIRNTLKISDLHKKVNRSLQAIAVLEEKINIKK